jgi:hypothetical protein
MPCIKCNADNATVYCGRCADCERAVNPSLANPIRSIEADRSINFLIRLLPDDLREPFPGHWYCGWMERWIRIPPPMYFQLRTELRRASAIANAITVTGPAWTAWHRSQSKRKRQANAAVNRIKRQLETCRKVHGLAVVKWWTPRNGKRAGKASARRLRLAA